MADPFNYRTKRIIVTGCFSGIGRATELLLTAGAEMHGVDRRDARASESTRRARS